MILGIGPVVAYTNRFFPDSSTHVPAPCGRNKSSAAWAEGLILRLLRLRHTSSSIPSVGSSTFDSCSGFATSQSRNLSNSRSRSLGRNTRSPFPMWITSNVLDFATRSPYQEVLLSHEIRSVDPRSFIPSSTSASCGRSTISHSAFAPNVALARRFISSPDLSGVSEAHTHCASPLVGRLALFQTAWRSFSITTSTAPSKLQALA